MITSLKRFELINYVTTQVNTNFPDQDILKHEIIDKHYDLLIQRVEYCFSKVKNKYFFDGKNSVFNHLHGDQYAMFLYFLSNTLFKEGEDVNWCAKVFLLNKLLHGLDAFYEVDLPDIFLLVHPLGTVLGRGNYSDYFIAYQRCGVGSNLDVYPTFKEFVTLHPGATVLGDSIVGRNCKIAAESLIIDRDIPENTVYIGRPKDFFIKEDKKLSDFWIV